MLHKKFDWFIQREDCWLGILELSNKETIETYRIRIELLSKAKLMFWNYKLEKFNYETRSWALNLVKSELFLSALIHIKNKCLDHVNKIQP